MAAADRGAASSASSSSICAGSTSSSPASSGPEGTTRIYVAVIIAAMLWAVMVLMMAVKDHPRSVIVIYALIAALLIRLSRQWAGAMLLRAAPEHKAGELRRAQTGDHLRRRDPRHPAVARA